MFTFIRMLRTELACAGAVALALMTGCARTPENLSAEGKRYLAARNYPAAIVAFRRVIRERPNDAEAHYQLATAYIEAKDATAGALTLRRLIEIEPKHLAARKKLAELMVGSPSLGIVEQGKAQAQAGLQLEGSDADLLHLLGFAELRLGDREASEKHLREAIAKFPKHLRAAMSLSTLKLIEGDKAAAEEPLLKLTRAVPDDAQAALALGRFYRIVGKPKEAESEFRRALSKNAKSEEIILSLANLLNDSGRRQEAEPLYQALSVGSDPNMRVIYGTFLITTGRYSEAAAELRRLLQKDPQNRDVRKRLVAALAADHKLDDATAVLRKALSTNAKDTDALLQLADIQLLNNKPSEAQAGLMQVLSFKPESSEAHLLLARVYRALGQRKQTRQELAEAVKYDPDSLIARAELGNDYLSTGHAQSALDLMNGAPESHRRSSTGTELRNWALYRLGQNAEFRKEVSRGLAQARTPGLLFQHALIQLADKRFDDARQTAGEALAKSPSDIRPLKVIAASYEAQGNAARAKSTVEEYAATHPSLAPVQQFSGEWMLQHGHRDEARNYFTAAVAADPKLSEPRLALTLLEIDKRNYDEARKQLLAIHEKQPLLVPALTQLAELEILAGRKAEAIDWFRRLIDIDPQNEPALNNLAVLLTESKPDEAVQFAQRAKELAPTSPSVDDTLGWAFYHKGLYSSAIRHLEMATSRSADAVHRYHLAMAYAKSGDRPRGERVLATALKVNPNLPEAEQARKALQSLRQ